MNLWLDDIRKPWDHGCVGWRWAKTADEAISLLQAGKIERASLDHDLSEQATLGNPAPNERTGYTVICWMEEHGVWPAKGVRIHSMNPSGRDKMLAAIRRYYGRDFQSAAFFAE